MMEEGRVKQSVVCVCRSLEHVQTHVSRAGCGACRKLLGHLSWMDYAVRWTECQRDLAKYKSRAPKPPRKRAQ